MGNKEIKRKKNLKIPLTFFKIRCIITKNGKFTKVNRI